MQAQKQRLPRGDEPRTDRVAEQAKQISVRISLPLETFLDEWGSRQYPQMKDATVARFAIIVFKGMVERLGGDWSEVTRRAADAGQDPGTYIGAALKALFESERRRK